MIPLTDEEFDAIVDEALAQLPQQFVDALDNIAIIVQDEPDDFQLESIEGYDPDTWDSELDGEPMLGLYEGVPLTERGESYGCLPETPDVITIFKGPHLREFSDRDELVTEIGKTVIHEIGHYFGIDDERLYEMGY